MDIFHYGRTPEEMGISSRRIKRMLDRIREMRYMCHSLLVARCGEVVSETYFAPFRKEAPHRMYSTSKSFAATAIGMLLGEGRLSLDDPAIKFYPELSTRSDVHPWNAAMTLRDLLRMATTYDRLTYALTDQNWVEQFFTAKPDHPAGTVFFYDTAASVVLTDVVERLTGKPYMEYLYDALLSHAGSSAPAKCIQTPDGISHGGSGVLATTRDFARLGQIYLNGGRINGTQFLPHEFAREAVTKQIDNNVTGHVDLLHGHGYGYQIWCAAKGCFGFYGMGGQLLLAHPETGLLMAMTGDVQGSAIAYQFAAELFYEELLEPLLESGSATLASDEGAFRELCRESEGASCPLTVVGESRSEKGESHFGKTYYFEETPLGIESLCVTRDGDNGELHYRARGEEKCLCFSFGAYRLGEFPEEGYTGDRLGQAFGRPYPAMTAAVWSEPEKLVIRCYTIGDHLGNLTVTLSLREDTVTVLMRKASLNFFEEYKGVAVGRLA